MGGRKIHLVSWEKLSLTSTGGVWLTGRKFLAESVINYGFPAAGHWSGSGSWAAFGRSNQGRRTSSEERLPRAINKSTQGAHSFTHCILVQNVQSQFKWGEHIFVSVQNLILPSSPSCRYWVTHLRRTAARQAARRRCFYIFPIHKIVQRPIQSLCFDDKLVDRSFWTCVALQPASLFHSRILLMLNIAHRSSLILAINCPSIVTYTTPMPCRVLSMIMITRQQ